jgi:hypothetical protein
LVVEDKNGSTVPSHNSVQLVNIIKALLLITSSWVSLLTQSQERNWFYHLFVPGAGYDGDFVRLTVPEHSGAHTVIDAVQSDKQKKKKKKKDR